MSTLHYLAQDFFMESLAFILLFVTVCSIMLKRIKGRQVIRMMLFLAIVLSLLFLFSFISIKDDLVEEDSTSACYEGDCSSTWNYVIVDY